MPAVSNITKVSDGPSEDAIINLNWYANGSSLTAPTALLDVSTLEAPEGMVVKAVSIQQVWSVINFNGSFSGGGHESAFILDSNDVPILGLDTWTDNNIDFCAGGTAPGLPDSDSVGNANGDLKYAVLVASVSMATIFTSPGRLENGGSANITLRLRKIYEDA